MVRESSDATPEPGGSPLDGAAGFRYVSRYDGVTPPADILSDADMSSATEQQAPHNSASEFLDSAPSNLNDPEIEFPELVPTDAPAPPDTLNLSTEQTEAVAKAVAHYDAAAPHVAPSDRRYILDRLDTISEAGPDGTIAEQDIRLRIDEIARRVTDANFRREFEDSLWLPIPRTLGPESRSGTDPRRPALEKIVADMVRDMLDQLVEEAIKALLLPGVDIILLPTNLIEAIFTAESLHEAVQPE